MNASAIQFTGHLGADPELRFNTAGDPWVKLRVAVNRRVKRGEEWVDAPATWWDVVASNALATNVDASLRKSDPVTVIGRVITEEYLDKSTGETRVAQKVRADVIAVPLAKHTVTVRKATAPPATTDATGGEQNAARQTDTASTED